MIFGAIFDEAGVTEGMVVAEGSIVALAVCCGGWVAD
jgi:hypothetical protein